MKTKIATFQCSHALNKSCLEEMDNKVNEFINENDIEVLDIKTSSGYDGYISIIYICTVLYKEKGVI